MLSGLIRHAFNKNT